MEVPYWKLKFVRSEGVGGIVLFKGKQHPFRYQIPRRTKDQTTILSGALPNDNAVRTAIFPSFRDSGGTK
jgi:hypothetical protein